jgi:hypothetical protein
MTCTAFNAGSGLKKEVRRKGRNNEKEGELMRKATEKKKECRRERNSWPHPRFRSEKK